MWVLVLLSPIRYWWFAWYRKLGEIKLVFDLIWIGAITLVASALLAPVEALGWWAGWYGNPLDTTPNSKATQPPQQNAAIRYVIYLDGN